jgi:hypothetical protein
MDCLFGFSCVWPYEKTWISESNHKNYEYSISSYIHFNYGSLVSEIVGSNMENNYLQQFT